MSLSDWYQKAFYDNYSQNYAAFPPTEKVELGDVGILEGRHFRRIGPLLKGMVGEVRTSDQPVNAIYRLGSAKQTELKVGADAAPLQIPLANAEISFYFDGGNGAVLMIENGQIESIEDLTPIRNEILRRMALPKTDPDRWQDDYSVVVERTVGNQVALFASSTTGTKAKLNADGTVPGVDALKLSLGLRIASETNTEVQFRPAGLGTATPLFRLAGVKRRFGIGPRNFAFLGENAPARAQVDLVPEGATIRDAATGSPSELGETYDELYVVSDLHISSQDELRTFDDDIALGWLGHELARRANEIATPKDPEEEERKKKIVWVLAGDIIDFLAYDERDPSSKIGEPGRTYFDPGRAVVKVQEVARACPATFEGIRAFARARGKVVVMLGNHDLELADGDVWRTFCGLAGLSLDTTRVMEGDFRAQVGGKKICVRHGNTADSWNAVNYPKLRKLLASPDDKWQGWVPNAGTKLVVDLMNDAKSKYPFVDLLKPEDDTVATVLLALGQPTVSKTFSAAWRQASTKVVNWGTGRLAVNGGEELFEYDAPPASSAEVLRILDVAADHDDFDPVDLLGREDALLGFGAYFHFFTSKLEGLTDEDSMRRAFSQVIHDVSFVLTEPDKFSDWSMRNYPGDAEILIAGHTHLAKYLDDGTRVYVNSGTWMPLINLRALLENKSSPTFKEFYELISQPDQPIRARTSIQQLEQGRFVTRPRNVVSVDDKGATLCRVSVSEDVVPNQPLGPLVTDEGLFLQTIYPIREV